MSEAKAAARPEEWRGKRRPVVKIDESGAVVARYVSAEAAAAANYLTAGSVKFRCYGKVKKEFAMNGYSFRYEDQWENGGTCE